MGEIPHLQAAVSRLTSLRKNSTPEFAVLNVSGDDEREALAKVIKEKDVPGIHTWDAKGRSNPILEQYNIRGFPTNYVLDADGVIRKRDVPAPELVSAIKALAKRGEASGG